MNRNKATLRALGVGIVLVMLVSVGVPISAGAVGSDASTAERTATSETEYEILQENNTTTTKSDDTATVNDTNNTTADWQTTGTLNNSTLQNLSREQLIRRIQSLQQVLNQTQDQYLTRIRRLQLRLNETQERVRRPEQGNQTNQTVTEAEAQQQVNDTTVEAENAPANTITASEDTTTGEMNVKNRVVQQARQPGFGPLTALGGLGVFSYVVLRTKNRNQ